jgi:hypothetical protein
MIGLDASLREELVNYMVGMIGEIKKDAMWWRER